MISPSGDEQAKGKEGADGGTDGADAPWHSPFGVKDATDTALLLKTVYVTACNGHVTALLLKTVITCRYIPSRTVTYRCMPSC